MCFSLGFHNPRFNRFGTRPIMVGPLIRYPSNVVETIDWRLSSRESFKSDQLRLIRIGESRGSWRERNDPENRASSLARLSPRLPQQREFMRHLFVVDSLDKHTQNETHLDLQWEYQSDRSQVIGGKLLIGQLAPRVTWDI